MNRMEVIKFLEIAKENGKMCVRNWDITKF